MTVSFDTSIFPKLDGGARAIWAPIVLEPISGSYERLVIGVAAANKSGFHVELANALDRLDCFYGINAEAIRHAIRIAGKCLKEDLALRSVDALQTPDSPLSGVVIGECRQGEGHSLEGIARGWMAALSSIYSSESAGAGSALELASPEPAFAFEGETGGSGDRLPFLVCDHVRAVKSSYERYFSADLRDGGQRRARGKSHSVMIDYAGPRLVANFGTLRVGSITNSVHLIKRRLWDLKVERDREPNEMLARSHEMILHRPAKDDPQVSTRQHATITEALEDLEQQADQEKLRLLALTTVAEIGQRIMKLEQAA